MRILILGAPGPYPERLSAFCSAGHAVWLVSTEPLPKDLTPFEGMTTLHYEDMGSTSAEATPQLLRLIEVQQVDAVYSLLNVWDGSNRATADLLAHGCPVPVIRHYKEHYFTPSEAERCCIEKSTGVVFINEESRDYFARMYRLPRHTACLDADGIPRRYLSDNFSPKLSAADSAPHLLIAGSVSEDGGRYDYRELIGELTGAGAHVHLYAQFRKLTVSGQLNNTHAVAEAYRRVGRPGYVHLHEPVAPARFVEEWSRYDAGLLHVARADDPFRVLNMPNRYSAYLAAGLPVALADGAMPAMQQQLEALGAGIIYRDIVEFSGRLPDAGAAAQARAVREAATFEAVFPQLLAFISRCVEGK